MPQFTWLMPVLIAAAIVFVVDLVCSFIDFDNRFLNALAQAVLFAIVYGLLVAYLTVTETTVVPVNP